MRLVTPESRAARAQQCHTAAAGFVAICAWAVNVAACTVVCAHPGYGRRQVANATPRAYLEPFLTATVLCKLGSVIIRGVVWKPLTQLLVDGCLALLLGTWGAVEVLHRAPVHVRTTALWRVAALNMALDWCLALAVFVVLVTDTLRVLWHGATRFPDECGLETNGAR